MERRAERTYQVHEANRLLPQVRRHVSKIVELNAQLPELQDQLRIAEYRMRRPDAGVQETDRFERLAATMRQTEDDLAEALRELANLGVRLKDARVGLVDFLSYRDGELVELCWRLGEPQVAHWHRIGEGYPGRMPI